MDGMRKKLKKSYGFGLAVLFLCMAGAAGLQAAAEEDAVVGVLYEVTADTEVKESASRIPLRLADCRQGRPSLWRAGMIHGAGCSIGN